MPIESTGDVIERVEDLQARLVAAVGVVGDAPTDADLQAVIAGLDGVRADGRALMTDLGLLDEEGLAHVDDGLVTVVLWRWRRATRSALVALVGQALEVQELAEGMLTGDDERVIVTREGDTLQRIASRELGDWREWPRLLAANPAVSAGALPSGTSLVIPPKR